MYGGYASDGATIGFWSPDLLLPLSPKSVAITLYIYIGLYINKEVFRQEHNSNINDKLAGQNLNHFLYPSLELGVMLYKTGE
jgi:hypothetical protein